MTYLLVIVYIDPCYNNTTYNNTPLPTIIIYDPRECRVFSKTAGTIADVVPVVTYCNIVIIIVFRQTVELSTYIVIIIMFIDFFFFIIILLYLIDVVQ